MRLHARSILVGMALIGLVLGGSDIVAAADHQSDSPGCDALLEANENADSHAQDGPDRAMDENGCASFTPPDGPIGPSPEPEL